MKIAMLGAGVFGKALGGVLTENGHDVWYYDIKLENKLTDVLAGAEAIVLCVPSDAALTLLSELPKNIPLIIATKGFLSLKPFDGFEKIMAISGPGFAKDFTAHKEITLTATDEFAIQLFETDYLKFDYTGDVNGVLLCGALKNVFALGAGLRMLNMGTPDWKQYTKDANAEMILILQANGSKPATDNNACGIWDLIITCSPNSRNFQFGLNIASGAINPNETVEGLSTLKRIRDGEIVVPDNTPILHDLLKRSSAWV